MTIKNWKTTLAGLLGGLIVALGPAIGARLQGDKSTPCYITRNRARKNGRQG